MGSKHKAAPELSVNSVLSHREDDRKEVRVDQERPEECSDR